MLFHKLWIARISMALVVLLLFIASSYALDRFWIEFHRTFLMHWELFGLSVLLQTVAGVLLGISPEVFFNLRNVRFNPIRFIVLAIIPIIVLVYIVGYWGRYWSPPGAGMPDFITFYFYTNFALITSSVWLGVGIGKAIHIRQ